MDIQKNWWELTACGSGFCEKVVRMLEESKSVALVGDKIPWFDTFYDHLKGAGVSASKVFECVNGAEISNPGEFLFNRYCSAEIQAKYWPDKASSYTHVDFLAETNGITLDQRFIIVRDLVTEKAFLCWKNFVEKYMKCVTAAGTDPENKAVFVLEYCGTLSTKPSLLSVIAFEPREVDMFTYNLVNTAEEYSDYLMNKYAAEMIGELCGSVIEQCGLLANFAGLLNSPSKVYSSFANETPNKAWKTEEQITAAVLSAQYKVIFPLIEQKRRVFIDKYYSSIIVCLPWTNDYSEVKNEPYDMELRDLVFKSADINATEDDKIMIKELKDARNQLAHNRVLSYDEICKIAK